MVYIIVANKTDLSTGHRETSFEEGYTFAKENNMEFFETSVKHDMRVTTSVNNMLEKLIEIETDENKVIKKAIDDMNTTKSKKGKDTLPDGSVRKVCGGKFIEMLAKLNPFSK